VPIKSWNCPSCQQNFIVDSEAERDTCPWCKATVEEKGEKLQVAADSAKLKEATVESAASGTNSSGNSSTGGTAGAAGANNASGATPGSGSSQSWWPFEYSS